MAIVMNVMLWVDYEILFDEYEYENCFAGLVYELKIESGQGMGGGWLLFDMIRSATLHNEPWRQRLSFVQSPYLPLIV